MPENEKAERVFTLSELKKYWKIYNSISGIRTLKDGKWHYNFNVKGGLGNIAAVRAEVAQLKHYVTFIFFLEHLDQYAT